MICKNTIGGIKKLFLTPYVYLPRRHFINSYYDSTTQLRVNPLYLLNASATASYSDSSYTQTLNFKTPNLINDDLLNDFKNKEYRAVIQDRNNTYWLLGRDNGISLKSNNSNTGTNKSDFNGYDLTFEGKELETFYKLENIEQFIENIVLFLSSSSEKSSLEKLTTDIYI